MPQKVLIALSGGIDSTAVCIKLQEAGYEVEGFTMRVFDLPRHFPEGGNEPDFIAAARKLAEKLGIPHHVADVREQFRNHVVRYFLDEYEAGRTPNPCVLCNRDFKFRLLTEWADRTGCEFMATGHYVRTEEKNGNTYLVMGDDPRKDQSYFLWRVPQSTLRRMIFPLGKLTKPEVRDYLAAHGMKEKAKGGESMEVCFIEGDYRDFLRQERPELAERLSGGSLVTTLGRKVGEHVGVPFYTIGQRKGLGVALGKPAYIVRLNAEKNTVVLGNEQDLLCTTFFAEDDLLVNEDECFNNPDLTVRIRYHGEVVPCRLARLDDRRLLVRTAIPVSAVAPGQSAVFYIGNRMVGGSVIASQKGIGAYATKD